VEESVEIVFEFDRPRRFTALRLHCNNMFTRNVRVFRRAVVRAGLSPSDLIPSATASGPTAAAAAAVVHEHRRDNLIDFARNVVVALPSLVGRYVRVRLYFDAPWMLVSEVRFESSASRVLLTLSPCLLHRLSPPVAGCEL